MSKRRLFGLDPEQLDRLLSLGTGEGEHVFEATDEDAEVGKPGDPSEKPPQASGVHPEDGPDESIPVASLGVFEERIGSWIGRYELLRMLGEGGMGIVYLAEQEHPFKRQVALKIIKPGMDSARIVARFEAERQALALLDHPNIAQIYDAGTTEKGRPYFVMEYVKGIPITVYCDHHQLSIEERLTLFLQACRAVQHAHQKGIIHRDVKPSNLLVSMQEGPGIPKIIDFGVAKALGQFPTDRALFTEVGQIVGTPEYMSPEQANMAEQDVDTRSDIYSLGVLLYVLLTGILPFDPEELREGGLEGLRRIILEKDPKTPSTRMLTLGDEAVKLAELRQTEIQVLARRLRSELEWIPLKAMRKEPARRYRTASELADDIENYLAGVPLIAGPESVSYRARKFVRKNRATVWTGLTVLVVLLLGLVISTAMFFRANEQRLRSDRLLATSQIEDGIAQLNQGNRLGLLDLLEAQTTARDIPALRDSAARLWAIAYDFCCGRLVHVMPEGQDLALSPDGRLLAIASGPTAQLWNMNTGKPQGSPLELGETIDAVLFSPNGALLATTSKRGVARLWDPNSGRARGPVLQHGEKVDSHSYLSRRSAAFSPEGKLLANALSDKTVQLWQTDTGKLLCEPLAHQGIVISVAVSPDGKWLATGSDGGKARLWTIDTEEPNGPVLEHTLQLGFWVEKVAFSPDGKFLAAASNRGISGLWHTDTGQLHQQLTQRAWMHDLAFSPNGKLLATASFSRTAQLWDTETGERVGNEMQHAGRVWQVAFSPDGKLLASVSQDGSLRLWQVPDAKPYGQPLPHIGYMALCADGGSIATTGWGATRAWNLEQHFATQKTSYQLPPRRSIRSSNGRFEATLLGETTVVRDTSTGKTLGDGIKVGANNALWVALSPDGKLFAVCWDYWKVGLFNVANGKQVKVFSCSDRPYAAAFGPRSKTLAVGLYNNEVIQWDVITGKQLGPALLHQSPVWAVEYSPDGNMLATASGKDRHHTRLRLWDISAGPPYFGLILPLGQTVPGYVALAPFGAQGKIMVETSDEEQGLGWCLPNVPADLSERQHCTWIALAAKRTEEGQVSTISWEQHRELRDLLGRPK